MQTTQYRAESMGSIVLRQFSKAIFIKLPKAVITFPYYAVSYMSKYSVKTVQRWRAPDSRPSIAIGPPGILPSPTPLPRKRPRALSLPTSPEDPTKGTIATFLGIKPKDPRQHTSPQSGCSLLTKLPLELRLHIWTLVVGGQRLHIIPSLVPSLTRPPRYTLIDPGVFYRLDHERCKWEEDDWVGSPFARNAHSACAIWVTDGGQLYFNAPRVLLQGHGPYEEEEYRYLRWWVRKNRILALTKTCRQIYTEAAPLLYKTNTFDFRNLDVLLAFPTTILPDRFQLIRSLTLQFTFMLARAHRPFQARSAHGKAQKDLEDWQKACALLAKMKNLRDVAVLLGDRREQQPGEDWKRAALEALGKVRVDGRFVARLTWVETEWEKEAVGQGALPFEIRRDFIDQLRR
ncbi:uncharacterized protein BDZ99DRAFT_519043 [Mytilinidion resinicola]|uniref:DUF7730 domain-containing protein n=1 Tax=Mytilinidion resinicola TaxID=574789 RepID=A0A6A6YS72_9PEZI|nr:uncharacterized protein BDZ99DRAFT_519043 [Mytilinidion resinicola]KAF2811796.1 hypothetical protein BDZ99DRAFT_519043 [Mytilinidion resinicola]